MRTALGGVQRLALCALGALAFGCGGGGGGDAPPPPPGPDLSGVWAGSWQGNDPQLGLVTGTWEATLSQGASSATGTATLYGDVDCMDGAVQGSAADQVVSGTFSRTPCQTNDWTLSSVDVQAGSAADMSASALKAAVAQRARSDVGVMSAGDCMRPCSPAPGARVVQSDRARRSGRPLPLLHL